MPRKNFTDDVSIVSEGGRNFLSRARSTTRIRSRSRNRSSSQSVTSNSSSMRSASRGRARSFFGSFRRGVGGNPDDASISDSLCSGVLGGEFDSASSVGNSFSGGRRRSESVVGSTKSIGASGRSAYSAAMNPPIPGGVADFNQNFDANFDRKPSEGNSIQSLASTISGMSQNVPDAVMNEAARREERKERVKSKLDRYKREQKQLRYSCVALEQQLAQTTEKLKEVDSKAAFKIDSLESELRETRGGLERVAKHSTKEVTDQGEVIKTLGKKLIRQAHVIKRQKAAVEQYKVKIEALQDEMNMQDERDSQRAEEYCQLKDQYDGVLEQKVQMQNMLQENIEEMMDLKSETERDAKSIMELEFNLQQKEATLNRVETEVGEKSEKVRTLELELEEKDMELDDMAKKLKESETSMEVARAELGKVNSKVEQLQAKCTAVEKANGGGGGRSMLGSLKEEIRGDVSAAINTRPPPTAQLGRSPSLLGWNRARDSAMDVETFEAELQAKDATIQTLDETVTEHEETIQSLKSDMVKMSSTYKQDSYLKRKEIAKLKQMNAEYALKLRALEKAFKSIGGSSTTITSATMHGLTSSTRISSAPNGGMSLSRHGKSMHSVGDRDSLASKEDKAAAVKARLGGLAPYEFPSADQVRQKESQIVVDSNFFEGSDIGSEEGRKGEFPEEC
mmetsp:Transcript_5664/g.12431  ORF Transcript_5664/g.12431 Transcript_5664/m.12431 type:complete len:680 (+) Transcript_5664:192-2231(+)